MRIRPTASPQIPIGLSNIRPASPHVGAPASSPASVDRTSILGLNSVDLPANVQAAFQSLLEEIARLKQDLDLHKRRVAELERLADEDTLLPLMNRRAFLRELTRFLSFAERYGIEGTLLYFDLNGMKRINDDLGHAAGDGMLLHFAHILLRNIRESDVLGRLGGDEFGIILAQADQKLAKEKAGELLAELGNTPFLWEGREIPVSCAIGIHQISDAGSADQALAEADKAMYVEKRRLYEVRK